MDFSFRKYFLSVLLFSLPGIVFSQASPSLRIAKENITCLYGLKNDSNRWVVPAQFTSLQLKCGYYFIASTGSKFGVLDQFGKIIIPVEYENISAEGYWVWSGFILRKDKKYGVADYMGRMVIPLEYDNIESLGGYYYYRVAKNNLYGLINIHNRIILPFEYQKIYFVDNTGGYVFSKKEKEWGYGDTTGITIPPVFSRIESFYGEKFLLVNSKTNPRKKGLVKPNGDTIVPLIYDTILYNDHNRFVDSTEKRILVGINNEYGVIDINGKMIIPVGLNFLSGEYWELYHFNNVPSLFSTDTIPVGHNHKWGLLVGNGTWITQQVYDSIVPIECDYQYDWHLDMPYRILQNGKYGTMDKKWNILIPPAYDSIQFCVDNIQVEKNNFSNFYFNPGTEYSDSYYYSTFFICKKGSHYGITEAGNNIWVPYIYNAISAGEENKDNDKLFFTNEKDALVFIRTPDNSGLGYGASIADPLTYFCKVNDSLVVYKSKNDYYPFYKPTKSGGKNLRPANEVEVTEDTIGKFLVSVITENADTFHFDIAGKTNVDPLRGLEIINEYKGNYIFRSNDKKLGITNKNGKIIIPPIYYGLQPTTFDNHSYLWIKFQSDTSCSFYHHTDRWNLSDCPCGWTLCDSLAHPISKVEFDYPIIFTNEHQIVYSNGKAGLFDLKKRKLTIPARYSEIVSVYPSYYSFIGYSENSLHNEHDYVEKVFFVKTNNSQFGIMDNNGKWLSDSTFTELYFLPHRNNHLCVGGNTKSFGDQRKLLTGNSKRLIIDEKGMFTTDSALIDSLIFQSFVLGDYNGVGSLSQDGAEYRPFRAIGFAPITNTQNCVVPAQYNWLSQPQTSPYGPNYLSSGPTIDVRSCSYYERLHSLNDSLFISAMQFSLDLLLNKYKSVFVCQPTMQLFKCKCATPNLNPVYDQEIVLDHPNYLSPAYKTGNYNGFLNRGEITFLSSQGFSLLLHFNPDSSSAGKNIAYPYFLNFRKTAKGFEPCTLDSIFCPDVNYAFVLNKLITEAISKRDDLNLPCNNPESYFALSHGRFSFSEEGLIFYIDNSNNGRWFSISIPWDKIKSYTRPGGIVDEFIGSNSGEHCKLPLDTTTIDFKFQKYSQVNDFINSDFLKNEKVKSCSYLMSKGKISCVQFCCEGNKVFDVYFKSVNTKNVCLNCGIAAIPVKIRKKKITKLICIKNFPCK
jgi:hypothetical protein